MDKLIAAKKTKKIGILTVSYCAIFAHGIVQNAYFIYQCLEHIGMRPEFLSVEDNIGKFGYKNMDVKKLSTDASIFDPSEYMLVITVSSVLTQPEYNMLHNAGVAVVNFACGNNFMLDMENFVKGPMSAFIYDTHSDETWVIPSWEPMLEYYRITRKKSAYTVPHLWHPCILKDSILESHGGDEKHLYYNIVKHQSKKINIIIIEPNMNLVKNAWLPICAAEKINLENPDLIEFVYVFNFPSHENSYKMVDGLSIKSKIRKFNRLPINQILTFFNASDVRPIFVSHHINHSLNYAYYELLHYGYPLVHNSLDLDGCGYYYPNIDISAAASAIKLAYTNHNNRYQSYLEKTHHYLERVNPLNKTVGMKWDEMISNVCAPFYNN